MATAVIFPGQGSQKLGMVSDLYQSDTTVQKIFNEANQILGYNLRDIIDNNQDKLNQTQFTQPALFVSSYAIWQSLSKGLKDKDKPVVFAGHSLGEYNALQAAAAISFENGLRLVIRRSQLMASLADSQGSMAAVLGLDAQKIIEICSEFEGRVSAANFNSADQTVIAGEKNLLSLCSEKLKLAGAKRVIILPVSVASHCYLMNPVAEKLAEFLDSININQPTTSVLHNVDCKSHRQPDAIKKALISQLYQSVLWHQTTLKFKESYQVNQVIEVGPGSVLANLAKKTKLFEKVVSINNNASLNEFLNQ